MLGYEKKNGVATGAKFTPEMLEAGAIEITEALWGEYKDCNQKLKKVKGGCGTGRGISRAPILGWVTHRCRQLFVVLNSCTVKSNRPTYC